MMRAKEFRTLARDTLCGKWGVAVAVCLVAGLLVSTVPSLFMGTSTGDFVESIMSQDLEAMMVASTRYLSGTWIATIISFILSGIVNLGMSDFFTRMVKGEPIAFKQLFGHFKRIWDGICMTFMVGLFTYLWSLLFIIPGIIAAYRYAMVPFLMAEFPDLGVMDAIRESKRLMQGNKWRLFCLNFSFFGWALLCSLTFGIGNLWLNPYMNTANAAFYLEVTGRGVSSEPRQPVQPDYLNRGPEF